MTTNSLTKTLLALGITAALLPMTTTAGDRHDYDKDRGGWQLHKDDHHQKNTSPVFNRIAAFPVHLNNDVDDQSVAEIVDVSKDGKTLIYTDGTNENIGFVDIRDPANPQPAGTIALNGEPTSVATAGKYALAGVNTSLDFVNTSGELVVIDIASQTIVKTFALDGQPDSVAVSPDGRYAAIVIENERDEDLGDGEPPQAPGGFLVTLTMKGQPDHWSLSTVDFTGVPDLFPADPEPEYVDINDFNVAVVSFQENNHLALVHLPTGKIINDFSAGTVDLDRIDTEEEDIPLISLTGSLRDIPREPDGVAWINNYMFATADEGDLNGGSRGATIFSIFGNVIYGTGNDLEHEVVRLGHYPDDRSGNKGNEPENVDVGTYGHGKDQTSYMFVASERSSVVFVYKIGKHGVELMQTLPAGVGPEGIKAIPARNLMVSAGEEDERGDGIRGVITIYELQKAEQAYPTVVSANRTQGETAGTPIPWAALSGLAMDQHNHKKAYTIHDSFYQQSRIYELDIKPSPAVITGEIVLKDSLGKLAAIDASLVNGDGTVNLDPEGIATSANGGFWIASEGAGTLGDAGNPFETLDLLLHVTAIGDIDNVVMLPASTNARQVRFGYEGVASVGYGDDETLFVAFQREWADDPSRRVRIGRYSVASGEWSFYYYPLDARESPNGGWVGLSEIMALGNDRFAVVERDNQANTDARIKRIYAFSVNGLEALADSPLGTTPAFPVVEKTLVRDLMPDLEATGGLVVEKIEGMTITRDGTVLVVNDNDGVDGSNGETQLLRFKGLF